VAVRVDRGEPNSSDNYPRGLYHMQPMEKIPGAAVDITMVGRGAGAPGAQGAKNERPWAGRGALRKEAVRYLEV
jgi:hypothetical protein